jgi:tetratricopeptide (TPR) repeat protein
LAPRSATPARLVLALGSLAFAACDRPAHDDVHADGPPAAPAAAARPARAALPAQLPWGGGAALAQAVEALESGDLPAARAALAAVGEESALDRGLLTARLRALEGDDVGAVAEIEAARARYPDQARVYATAAELHAVAGRLESAEDEVRAGLLAAGPTPDLTRARGVLALSRPGGAGTALEHLLAARAAAPGLAFCDGPLAQAHVLLGRGALAEERVLEALGHAQAALSSRSGDPDALELFAEAQTQSGDYDGAIATYEVLFAGGHDVGPVLAVTCQRGSTAALLGGQRRLALERALRARELGLSDGELGFSLTLISDEAERALDRGVELLEKGSVDAARVAFELAVRCLPRSAEAHHHLAVALLSLGDAGAAAEHWRAVLTIAAEDGLELPEPVHILLSRALSAASRPDEARAELEGYLAASPDGRWAAETRAELAAQAGE